MNFNSFFQFQLSIDELIPAPSPSEQAGVHLSVLAALFRALQLFPQAL